MYITMQNTMPNPKQSTITIYEAAALLHARIEQVQELIDTGHIELTHRRATLRDSVEQLLSRDASRSGMLQRSGAVVAR